MKEIKRKAMRILLDSYNGLTFFRWCVELKKEFTDIDDRTVKEAVSSLVEHHPKVEYLEDKTRGRVYVHFNLLK